MKEINQTFSKKFFIIFLMPLVIIFILTGFLYYRYEKNLMLKTKYIELKTIAELKISQILSWLHERTADLEVLSYYFETNRSLYSPANRSINKTLDAVKKAYDYQNVFITDEKLNIIYSNTDNESRIDNYLISIIMNNSKNLDVFTSDFYRCSICGSIHFDFIKAVYAENEIKFFIITRINPEKYIYPLIQSWPTPSRTAETLLIRNLNNEVLFLNELRHRKNTALNLRIPLSKTDIPSVKAVLGSEGYFEGSDYRGIKVLSDIHRIQGTSWFMVSKIDKKEILAELNFRIIVIIIIESLIIFLIFMVLTAYFNSTQKKVYKKLYLTELDKKVLKAHLENLTKYANDIIILTDEKHNIIDANKKAEIIYNYSPEEFKNLNMKDLWSHRERKNFESEISSRLNSDGVIYETMHKNKKGHEFPVEVSARIIKIEKTNYYQSIIRDITDRKKNEKTIKKSLEENQELLSRLNNKNKELENIINVISHDLRSPLINIVGFSQQVEGSINELLGHIEKMNIEKEKKEEILPYLKEKIPLSMSFIKTSFLKMESLLKGLLAVSRTGRTSPEYSRINMNALLNEIISVFNYRIKETDASVIIDEIPDCYGDYNMINQLFSNLFDNALKYRDKNRKTVIQIKAEKNKDNVIYIVKDNGIGIPKEYHDKIWNLFTRLTSDAAIQGEGIGLSLVLSIVQKHNGKIWLESDTGTGTTFYVQFPKKSKVQKL